MVNRLKIIGVLVVISVLLLLMTVSVNADSTEIQRVDIKTDKAIPEIGDKVSDLDYNYEVYANETTKLSTENIFDNEIGLIECYKKTDNNLKPMEENERFVYEGTYVIERLFVVPNEMNIINPSIETSDTQAYINGEKVHNVKGTGSGDARGEYYIVSTTFTLDKRENVEKVNIKSNGLLPKAGDTVKSINKNYEAYANNEVKLSTELTDTENVSYYLKENNEHKILDDEYVFEEGKTYIISINFVIPEKMCLIGEIKTGELGYICSETEGMINGKKVGYVTPNGMGDEKGEYCSIYYEYTIENEKIENENQVKDESPKKDTTTAPGKVPYAGGTTTIMLVSLIIVIIGTVVYIKNKNLKGI